MYMFLSTSRQTCFRFIITQNVAKARSISTSTIVTSPNYSGSTIHLPKSNILLPINTQINKSALTSTIQDDYIQLSKQSMQQREYSEMKKKKKKVLKKITKKKIIIKKQIKTVSEEWKNDWCLRSAVFVERLPTITPDKEQWMIDYEDNYFEKQAYYDRTRTDKEMEELAKSVTNEALSKRDKKKKEARKKRDESTKSTGKRGTLKDKLEAKVQIRDVRIDEFVKNFKPAPRITEADRNDDRYSLNRALASRLFLVVRAVEMEDGNPLMSPLRWTLPSGLWRPFEPIRKTAHRNLKSIAGDELSTYFYANSPAGHIELPGWENPYSKLGEQVYFFPAMYLSGTPKLRSNVYCDYAWIKRSEFEEYLPLNIVQTLKDISYE